MHIDDSTAHYTPQHQCHMVQHIKQRLYPYILSAFIVLIFAVIYIYEKRNLTNNTNSLAYPLSKYNVDDFTKTLNDKPIYTSAMINFKQIQQQKQHNVNIYGPFENQPIDVFEPFNINSLLFVSFMFFASWVLLSY